MKKLLATSSLFASIFSAGCSYADVPANAVWIDVRSPAEFAGGHLEAAHLIPHEGIEAGVAQLGVSKDTPLYLYCRSGNRAGIAKGQLEQQGFTNVVNVGSLKSARSMATGSAD